LLPFVTGVLCGFDRLFMRASLRNLVRPFGLQNYLWANRIPFKDFCTKDRLARRAMFQGMINDLAMSAEIFGMEQRIAGPCPQCSMFDTPQISRKFSEVAIHGLPAAPRCPRVSATAINP
jgi:hypothetical protein